LFDLEALQSKVVFKDYGQVKKFAVDSSSMHKLIRGYLEHYGYVETLQAIEDDNDVEEESKEEQAMPRKMTLDETKFYE